MALVFMERGGIVHVSDDDYEAASGFSWRVFRLKPSGREVAWVPHQANRRRFDLFLHRLIAVRIDPSLDHKKFTVRPRDGDYLNCRRENLEIVVQRTKRQGQAPKPGGHPVRGARRSRPRPYRNQGDLALLWNPGKHLPTTRKIKPRRGEGGDGPAGGEVGVDPR